LRRKTYLEKVIQEFVDKTRQVVVLRGSVQTDKIGAYELVTVYYLAVPFGFHDVLEPITLPYIASVLTWRGNISIDCFHCSFCRGVEMQYLTVSNQKVV